jgi:hypothetical protein
MRATCASLERERQRLEEELESTNAALGRSEVRVYQGVGDLFFTPPPLMRSVPVLLPWVMQRDVVRVCRGNATFSSPQRT